MHTAADLHRTVQTAIASKRLGKPVFVRYLLTGPDKAPLVTRLARLVVVVRDWLGQALDGVQAIGSATVGQVSLTLRFREGGSALVSVARSQRLGNGIDLMVLGNHGALYHDAGHASPGGEPAALSDEAPEPGLVAVIDKALRSGKPEAVQKEAKR
jgi:hypothetical protein